MLTLNEIADPHKSRGEALDCYEACKQVYKHHKSHPNLIRAQFMADSYNRNVPRYVTIWLVAIISYLASLYYSYQVLIHQHGSVKKSMILLGFFAGFNIIYFTNFQVNSDDPQQSLFNLMPLYFRKITPFSHMIFISSSLVPEQGYGNQQAR